MDKTVMDRRDAKPVAWRRLVAAYFFAVAAAAFTLAARLELSPWVGDRPVLATYLGHARYTDTAYYITGTAELLGMAADRAASGGGAA